MKGSKGPVQRGVRFHPSSERELAEAIDFLNDEAPGLGFRLSGEVKETIGKILRFPETYAITEKSVRAASLDVFRYTIFFIFEKESDRIFVVAIAHQSRHPDYWKDRLRDAPD